VAINTNKRATNTQIEGFLRLFGGDVDAAVAALRGHLSTGKPIQASQKPSSAKTLISVELLEKRYKVGHQTVVALNGVSLEIGEGEFVAITGTSGSGKSTLLQLMGGLDKPSSGHVVVDGVDLSKMSDGKLSRFRGQTIGFVFQFFYLQPFLNVRRNLEVPGMFAHVRRKDRLQKVQELSQAVGLSERLDHLPKELSGGQIQRAAVARALLNNPKVILADEPTGNLDSQNGEAVIDLFEDIRTKFGTTIVVATHDTSIARRADRVISLKDGTVA
jgi:putative ABC transport system ATP-binding protein